ncbi:MAG: Dihydrodipicolinate reductase [Parcubacteria group bacterium GW2011_GWA2_49_9]|nr:MAG: Dihydrodipicolinate reductase [Parcubacteria group bacterium GW2011_GWA2_49_9]
MHLIIAGRGALAQAIVTACQDLSISYALFDATATPVPESVAVHCSKTGTILPDVLRFCEERSIPLIQASTGMQLPGKVNTVVVDAPNLALPIVRLFGWVKGMHQGFESIGGFQEADVAESHQESKTSVPGTASTFADAVGVKKEKIRSIRAPALQQQLGVSTEHLNRHGYHWITWRFPDLEVEVRTRVHGLRPYALGAIHVARNLLATPNAFEKRVYSVIAVS